MRPRADSRHPRPETGESQLFLVLCATTVDGGMRPQPDGRHPAPNDTTISATTVEGDIPPRPDGRRPAPDIDTSQQFSQRCPTAQTTFQSSGASLPSNATPFSFPHGIIALRSKGASLHSNTASFHADADYFLPKPHHFSFRCGIVSFFQRGIAAVASSEAGAAVAIGTFARPVSQALCRCVNWEL